MKNDENTEATARLLSHLKPFLRNELLYSEKEKKKQKLISSGGPNMAIVWEYVEVQSRSHATSGPALSAVSE